VISGATWRVGEQEAEEYEKMKLGHFLLALADPSKKKGRVKFSSRFWP